MKRHLFLITFIVLLCGCTGGALMAQENFEVKYKIIQGKKLAQIIDIPANWNDDYYYVTQRESGGTLGWLYDLLAGKDTWFALLADDGK